MSEVELGGRSFLVMLLDIAWYWLLLSLLTSSVVSCEPSDEAEEEDDELAEDDVGSDVGSDVSVSDDGGPLPMPIMECSWSSIASSFG